MQRQGSFDVQVRSTFSRPALHNSTQEAQKKKKITPKLNCNIYQRIYQSIDPPNVHNFLNLICINEDTIKNSQQGEAYFKTMFYFKSIRRMEISSNAIFLDICANQTSFPPLQYLLDRFRSFGDSSFALLADSLQQLSVSYSRGLQTAHSESQEIKRAFLENYMEQQKGRCYILKIMPNTLVFSKEMLALIGTTPEEMVESVKFRCLTEEIFAPYNYSLLTLKAVQMLNNYMMFRNGEISEEQYVQSLIYQYEDVVRDKHQRDIKVNVRCSMPRPYVMSAEITGILSQPSLPLNSRDKTDGQKIKKGEFSEDFIRQNARTLKYLTKVSDKYFPQNSARTCSYVDKMQIE